MGVVARPHHVERLTDHFHRLPLTQLVYQRVRLNSSDILLVVDPLDQTVNRRKAWRYDPDSRRVRILPKLAYDSVQPDTNVLMLSDMFDAYNGAPDKYTWSSIKKNEMIVPCNSYNLHQAGLASSEVILDKHINDALLLYEPHRVLVVEANLRFGHKHVYGKRRFYIDEDSWQILDIDLYHRSGKELIAHQKTHPINYYEAPIISSTLERVYNFRDSSFTVEGLDNKEVTYDFSAKLTSRDLTVLSLRREGR